MNNEPVAWMSSEDPADIREVRVYKHLHHDWIPLYTTPQIKELSDEEIYKIYMEVEDTKCPSDDFEYMMFARALLKKVNDK